MTGRGVACVTCEGSGLVPDDTLDKTRVIGANALAEQMVPCDECQAEGVEEIPRNGESYFIEQYDARTRAWTRSYESYAFWLAIQQCHLRATNGTRVRLVSAGVVGVV